MPVVDERRTGAAGQAAVRLAVIDSDTGFLQVLGKRLEGWAGSTACSPRRSRWTRWSRCG